MSLGLRAWALSMPAGPVAGVGGDGWQHRLGGLGLVTAAGAGCSGGEHGAGVRQDSGEADLVRFDAEVDCGADGDVDQ